MKTSYIVSLCAVCILFTSIVVHAEVTATASTSVNVGAGNHKIEANAKAETHSTTQIANAKDRANKEIDRRVQSLNKLSTRIQSIKHISADQKNSLSASVQSQITILGNLKTKIAADTDLTVLKTDVKSITDSYRIYALVMPQVEIIAAADRILTIADAFTQIEVKLQAGITQAQSNGKDVSAFQATLTSIKTKVDDAKVQANAALSSVATLTPDNGDKTKADANRQALVQARAKIKIGSDDLKSARKSVDPIVKGLKS